MLRYFIVRLLLFCSCFITDCSKIIPLENQMALQTEELHPSVKLKLLTPPRMESVSRGSKLEKLTHLTDIHLGLRYRKVLGSHLAKNWTL